LQNLSTLKHQDSTRQPAKPTKYLIINNLTTAETPRRVKQ
jgi:hypothetical protein